jgi:hypothetical protein
MEVALAETEERSRYHFHGTALNRLIHPIMVAPLAWVEIQGIQAAEGIGVARGSQEKAHLNVEIGREMETPTESVIRHRVVNSVIPDTLEHRLARTDRCPTSSVDLVLLRLLARAMELLIRVTSIPVLGTAAIPTTSSPL